MKIGGIIFERLKGNWTFQRILPENGLVKGSAEFKEIKPGILNYREQGVWRRPDQSFAISKDYQYRYDPEIDQISVYFIDQEKPAKLFYKINIAPADEKTFAEFSATGEHQCNKDNYKAQYQFINENQFSLIYFVKGPKKNYISETIWRRVNNCAIGGTC